MTGSAANTKKRDEAAMTKLYIYGARLGLSWNERVSERRGQKQNEKKRRKGKDRRSYLTVFG